MMIDKMNAKSSNNMLGYVSRGSGDFNHNGEISVISSTFITLSFAIVVSGSKYKEVARIIA